MKRNNYKLLKLLCGCLLLLPLSCKKNTQCNYETTCVEIEPSGFMVGTMASDPGSSNRVGTIFKTAANASAPIGDDWNEPALGANRVQHIFPKYWVKDSIGQVFGIALDHNGGIYLSATDLYKYDELSGAPPGQPTGFGAGGAAAIYYTNYATPNVTTVLTQTLNSSSANTAGTNKIPNSGTGVGNSIGNIAFDYAHNQLFATNLEDGRIYRINPVTGIVKSIFDPFSLDNGIAGMAPAGEQIWGVGVLTQGSATTVYFARTTAALTKEIWSIQLDAAGEFVTTAAGSGLFIASAAVKSEIAAVPGAQSKITDIAFSTAGRMLMAERGHPHKSKTFEYVYSGSWNTGNSFYVGTDFSIAPYFYPLGGNSAGGVDYSNRQVANTAPGYACNDIAWASGNAMFTKTYKNPLYGYPNYVYGVQGMSSAGNSATLSANAASDLYIDYNCTGNGVLNHTGAVKGKIGDVEFFDAVCPCK